MDKLGLGITKIDFMVDTLAVDDFLSDALRKLRCGGDASWPDSNHEDWSSSAALTAVWSRIDVHGIAVLLNSQSGLLTRWPEKMLARIAEEARLLGLWEITHSSELARLLDQFAKAGIENVLMKGTALAYSVYPDPSARRRGDSDLLIRPADTERARAILREAGWYRNEDPHGLTFQEGWLRNSAGEFVHAIDLHWQVSDRPVLQRVLDADEFLDHRLPLKRLSATASRADHLHTMIHEAINQKWHYTHGYWAEEGRVKGARRLIWSVDFDLLASALGKDDWQRLVEFCAQHGIGPLLSEALRGAIGDLGTQIPDGVLEQLDAVQLRPEIAEYLATTDKLSEFWLDLRTSSGWRTSMRMVLYRSFPPRGHLIEKYPHRGHWPTFALQAISLIQTAGRIIRRVMVR